MPSQLLSAGVVARLVVRLATLACFGSSATCSHDGFHRHAWFACLLPLQLLSNGLNALLQPGSLQPTLDRFG
jgi:hypothetical protein